MSPVQPSDLDNLFTYHSPTASQQEQYIAIRNACKVAATVILQQTPQCADQQAAVRKIREAMMTANAAIATDGKC
jgi:hypothetical protein